AAGRHRRRRDRRGRGRARQGALPAVPALDGAVRRAGRSHRARAVPRSLCVHPGAVPRLVSSACRAAPWNGRAARGAERPPARDDRRAAEGGVAALRRYRPAALGVGTFLLTLPFLFGGGSGAGDIPIFRSHGDGFPNGELPSRDSHPESPPGAFLFFVLPSLGPDRRYLLIFQLIAAAGIVLGLVLLALLVDRLGATERFQYFALFFAGISPL